MADEALRSALREAQAHQDGATWLRAAQALGRAGRSDEAATAALRASRLGEAVEASTLLDELGGGRLADLEVRTLGEPRALTKLSGCVWSPDGRMVYAANDRDAVHAFDLDGTASRQVAPFGLFAHRLWLDLDGRTLLAAGGEIRGPFNALSDVLAVDLEEGTTNALQLGDFGNGIEFIRSLAGGGDLVVVASQAAAAAYSRVGTAKRGKPTWRVTAPLIAVDAHGVVSFKRGKLLFHDLLVQEPRATLPFELNREVDIAFIEARGRRALVVDDHATLVTDQGQVLGRRKLPFDYFGREHAVSASGRRLALHPSDAAVFVLDVLTGETREFAAPARVRGLAWSPSGTRLAITTDLGTVITLVGSAPAVMSPARAAAGDVAWLELTHGQRFWFARRVGAVVQVRFGQTGQRGSATDVPCKDEEAAEQELRRRARAKEREGYKPMQASRPRATKKRAAKRRAASKKR